jgi:hypothetical protein
MKKVYITEINDVEKFPRILCKVRGKDIEWQHIVNGYIPTTACTFDETQAHEIVNILGVEEIILRPVE